MFTFSWDHKGGKGPWGQPRKTTGGQRTRGTGQNQSSNNNGGPEGPDVDAAFRQAQERIQRMMGGGNNGGMGKNFIGLVVAGIAGVWLLSGFYIVAPDERGVVLRFCQYVQTTNSGLNYHLPAPIESVIKPKVTRENVVEIGFRSSGNHDSELGAMVRRASRSGVIDVPAESLMLTGDENIVDLTFTVRWIINEPRDFLFNIADPVDSIKNVAESAMREVIGENPIDDALTENKQAIEDDAGVLIQSILDSYQAGVKITKVELQRVNPPKAVIDAFRDVQAARADAEREQNQALGYANDILPRARGEAAKILQEAEGYKTARVAEAQGSAQRFLAQQAEYAKAKTVTKQRMYLETMEKILKDARKVVVGGEGGNALLPYLNLNELRRKPIERAPQQGGNN